MFDLCAENYELLFAKSSYPTSYRCDILTLAKGLVDDFMLFFESVVGLKLKFQSNLYNLFILVKTFLDDLCQFSYQQNNNYHIANIMTFFHLARENE